MSGAAASGEVAVLGADDHLRLQGADARPCVDAGAAARLDDLCADGVEHLDVALPLGVLAHLLRAELDEAPHVRVDAAALRQGVAEDAGVHVHVFLLAGGARAAIGDVDLHRLVQLINEQAIAGVAGRGDHRAQAGRVNVNRQGVLGVRVALHACA